MSSGRYLFTSESVSMGHPDKLADQISDGVLDALLAQDPKSRVACETMVTTGIAIIAGEITTNAVIDYQQVVRDVIRDVGYTDDEMGICYFRVTTNDFADFQKLNRAADRYFDEMWQRSRAGIADTQSRR